jgi:uncharacterized damage-inducible protein DinB
METPDRVFLDFSSKKLKQLFSRIQDCVRKLNDEQLWARGSENENAIGNLILHLTGNVRQWIISGVGGAPDVRVRDREFSTRGGVQSAELLNGLEQTLNEADAVLASITAERLLERVTIQKYHIPVLEAVYHVVEHFAQHTGQIIFATKWMTGEDMGFYAHLKTPATHSAKTP